MERLIVALMVAVEEAARARDHEMAAILQKAVLLTIWRDRAARELEPEQRVH